MLTSSSELSSTERPRLSALAIWSCDAVHFVTDEPAKIPAIRQVLEPRYRVIPRILGSDGKQPASSGVLMIDADLRKAFRVKQIRQLVQEVGGVVEKLFVVRNSIRPLV